jgi:hypothetical protein
MSQRPFSQLSPDQLTALQARFLEIRPQIENHGRIYFRHIKCCHRLADLVAEMVSLGWKYFVRLVLRGKDPRDFLGLFIKRLAQHVKCGRRVTGKEKPNDVMSSQAQQLHSFTVQSLPRHESSDQKNEALDALQDNHRTPPPDQAAFRIDFPAWRLTRSERDRRVIDELMLGERTLDVSQRFGLCPGRISQLRREFCEDWERFCDN